MASRDQNDDRRYNPRGGFNTPEEAYDERLSYQSRHGSRDLEYENDYRNSGWSTSRNGNWGHDMGRQVEDEGYLGSATYDGTRREDREGMYGGPRRDTYRHWRGDRDESHTQSRDWDRPVSNLNSRPSQVGGGEGYFGSGDVCHGPHKGKGPQSYKRSDDRIREDVSDRLTDDGQLDASHIAVAVQDGEVTFSGSVSDRRAKRRAEDIADNVSGVTHVQNNLRVSAPQFVPGPTSQSGTYRTSQSASDQTSVPDTDQNSESANPYRNSYQ